MYPRLERPSVQAGNREVMELVSRKFRTLLRNFLIACLRGKNGSFPRKPGKSLVKVDISEIFFRGYESNLEKIFSNASLMILTSKRESFGLVIIEAFSYGVPVIAYSTDFGVDDLIENNRDGYITTTRKYR